MTAQRCDGDHPHHPRLPPLGADGGMGLVGGIGFGWSGSFMSGGTGVGSGSFGFSGIGIGKINEVSSSIKNETPLSHIFAHPICSKYVCSVSMRVFRESSIFFQRFSHEEGNLICSLSVNIFSYTSKEKSSGILRVQTTSTVKAS